MKRQNKREIRKEKRRTGFEHLKDKVKFGEVVQAPPVFKTLPKKVGGTSGASTKEPKPTLDQ